MNMNPTNQRIVEMLVQREVLCCASYLILHLCKVDNEDERLLDLVQRRTFDFDDVVDVQWLTLAINNDICYEGKTPKEACIKALGEDGCADELGIEPTYNEVYEHWIVSGWALERLREKGETVCEDLHGLDIWGRCCTGQSISLDHVWWEIAHDMEILQGQANSWENR